MKRKKRQIKSSLRFTVFQRDGFTCQYCGQAAPEVVLHCDHIVAESAGGKATETNLVTACQECNGGKGARSLNSTAEQFNDATRLVGMYGHRFKGPLIDMQFKVIRWCGMKTYLIQLYDFAIGSPGQTKEVSADFLLNKCRLYPTHAKWIEKGDQVMVRYLARVKTEWRRNLKPGILTR